MKQVLNNNNSIKTNKWGFVRETRDAAKKAGLDKDTGLHRTGLEEYLSVIFPNTHDWKHDEIFDNLPKGINSKRRPDYRSKSLMLIVEFDGLQHYTSPDRIKRDMESNAFYESLGYKVVRIPYFIQLSNSAVEKLFGVKVEEKLFDESYPSLGPKGGSSPAYLCMAGIERMAREFKKFPKQYRINVEFLKKAENEELTRVSLLEKAYNTIK